MPGLEFLTLFVDKQKSKEEDEIEMENKKKQQPSSRKIIDATPKDEDPSTSKKEEDDTTTLKRISPRKKSKKKLDGEGKGDEEDSSQKTEDDEIEGIKQDKDEKEEPPIKLYKSSRLKGYFTLCFASSINFNATAKATSTISPNAVPATHKQQQYAYAVSMVTVILSTAIIICHLDRITALQRIWNVAFRPKSKIELFLILFLVLWWSIAVGIGTSVGGIAGDGKGQFSYYYSAWASCLCSFWILENWWVDCGWASFKSFISSWPYRSPAWICIMFLSLFTMIWYVDLFKNHDQLTRDSEEYVYAMFASVPHGQWVWLIALAVFTLAPSVAFVLIELFRDIRPDGSNEQKSFLENIVEGVIFFALVLAWIPSVAVATTPGGIASLIGNAYFFTWLLVVFLFEGLVWWIHDYRLEIHQALREKANEYREHQRQVLEKTNDILGQNNDVAGKRRIDEEDESESEESEIGLSEPVNVFVPDVDVYVPDIEEFDIGLADPVPNEFEFESEEFYDAIEVTPAEL